MNSDFFAALNKPADFLIIRHGQSEGNAGKILQGRGEYPLSETGRLQAAARGRSLKHALAGTKPEKVLLFSSPQGRALDTARIIAGEAGFSAPVCLDVLVEMHLGIWSGRIWDTIIHEDPVLWAEFQARSWDAVPEAESSAALYERALRAWTALRDAAIEKDAEKVIAVSHGGLIQWLLRSTFQCRAWFPLFQLNNCGLSKLSVEPRREELSAYMSWAEINSPVTIPASG